MTLSPWLPLFLAVPVLVLGEWLVRRIHFLNRFNIPAPVVGGLVVSFLVLLANLASPGSLRFATTVTARWWTWLVTIEPEWVAAPAKATSFPLMAAFFTCIGLNATWNVIRKGSYQVALFLFLASVLAALQGGLGVGLAQVIGVDPLLGLVCGSVSMTGGHGTSLGFSGPIEEQGLANAALFGAAAATLGLVAGGLLGGPIGGRLIRRHQLAPEACAGTVRPQVRWRVREPGLVQDVRTARRMGVRFVGHALVVLGCIKVGAWVSHFIQLTGFSFSAQIGAMVVGVVLRNALDLSGRNWIGSDAIDTVGTLALGLFLAMAMMSLNLIELANTALPMLVILGAQVLLMAGFGLWVIYPLMGRDYDAAVMAAGHCGFGLGATPNAVANMQSLVDRFGPAPRAFLVVPVVGALLTDFTNSLVITFFLNAVR